MRNGAIRLFRIIIVGAGVKNVSGIDRLGGMGNILLGRFLEAPVNNTFHISF
jgi:hypothetical protein